MFKFIVASLVGISIALLIIIITAPAHAASSQHLTDELACNTLKYDVATIANFAAGGAPKEDVAELAQRSDELTPQHLAAILALIEEGYAFNEKGNLDAWVAGKACK